MNIQATDFAALQRQNRARSRQAGVRDLDDMLRNAESSRVLNLSRIHQEWGDMEDYAVHPLFENKALNRSIVIKQTVSPSETYNFRKARPGGRATKVIFPLDRNDYSLGGLYLFVGQNNFSAELANHFSGDYRLSDRDEKVLQMVDELPTLDPFLLYALLKSNDFYVSEIYFQVTENDRRQIQSEMTGEFRPLVSLCFPNTAEESEKIRIFIDKILNFSEGEELAALRESFKLERQAFAQAMFAWRGLIYYKWRSRALKAKLEELTASLARIRPTEATPMGGRMLELSRTKILRIASGAGDKLARTIARYDAVFADFVQGQQVEKFRAFLKLAPAMFANCGQSIAILEHIINFFDRKAKVLRPGTVSSYDFARVLADLEVELGLDFQVKLRIW
jgi:hypothetical protein